MTFRDAPRRWEEDPHADEVVRRLLRAGKHDGPSARALGAAPAGIAALLSANAAGAVGTAAATAKGALSAVVLAKWFGGGILAGTVLMTATHATRIVGDDPRASQPQAVPATPVATAVVAPVRPRSALPPVEQPQPPARVATVPASPPPGARSAPSAPPSSRITVAREVALLDAARAALVAGDASEAVRVLDALERLPERTLVPEATVLRVRALLARGEVSRAQQLAASFHRSSPDSPQARVLRALLASPRLADSANTTFAPADVIRNSESDL
jgi:hypothetical protein